MLRPYVPQGIKRLKQQHQLMQDFNQFKRWITLRIMEHTRSMSKQTGTHQSVKLEMYLEEVSSQLAETGIAKSKNNLP